MLKKLLSYHLGQKTGAGFPKVGRDVMRLSWKAKVRARRARRPTRVRSHAQKAAAERLRLLRNAEGAPGQFLWAILRNSFHIRCCTGHYCRQRRDVDGHAAYLVMKQGPF